MSTKTKRRRELEAALNAAMRDVSGQGVLYSQAVADRLGMNSTDLECLDHISRGPVTAGRLAKLTGLTTGAITGVIDRLERAGLARRRRDADDRRKTLVSMLPAVAERLATSGMLYVEAPAAIAAPRGLEVWRGDKAGQVHYHLLRRAAPAPSV